jgi:predicted RNA-binding protein Jag
MTEKATKESGLQRHIGIKKYGKQGFAQAKKKKAQSKINIFLKRTQMKV